MKALLIKPWSPPEVVDIKNDLDDLQEAVGGDIEVVTPYDEEVAIVCNENGKILDLPPNRMLKDRNGVAYDVLCGDFLVVGLNWGTNDFCDLTDEQIQKYSEMFR